SRTALLRAVEHERRRIEADLHDRVQHRLVALAVTLGIAENSYGQDPTGRLAAEAHAQLDTALAELRSVILGIQPRTLTDYGLVAAVIDLIATYPLPVGSNFGRTETAGRLPPHVEQVAYLVVTEALTNVAKHAAATTVAITADRDGNGWWLTVRDDGIGDAGVRPGHGLAALRNHLGAMEGALTINSPSGDQLRSPCDAH
ncbi:histidine kinase, partial [Williamsia sp.]|uniref:sensor histidine kinase n=1 Tax=Williamsia sp. TaxID=1872085 RepID=UPI0025F8E1F6